MSNFRLIPLWLLVVLVASAGAERPPDFTFINRGEVGTLDPNRMSWLQDIRIGYALWEGLYSLDPQTLDPVPGAADKIEINPDKTVYTFHIRRESKWSNGDAVTSADFVFAWRRMLREPGDYTYLLHYIKGAEDYEEAFAKDSGKANFKTVGLETPDAATLRVTLRHPVTFFPDLAAFPPFFPQNEKSMEPFREVDKTTGKSTYGKQFTLPPNLITNGPYRLVSWQLKRGMRLEASEFYWDSANVKSKVLEMVSVDEPLASFLKYDQGGVDWLAEITGQIASELLVKKRADLHVFPGFGTYFYSINCQPQLAGGRKNPFADIRVRQAFAMAVNKKPIVDNITRLGEPVSNAYIPPGVFKDYNSPKGLAFDPQSARKLLADAGYPGGKGFPKFSVLYNSEGQHGLIAQVVAKHWETILGIRCELEAVEIKTFRQRLHEKEYDIARASWYGDYNDPSTFTDKYLSNSGNNDSGWINAEYDKLCNDAAPEPDPARRLRMLEKAEDILCREAPIIPLYNYVNAYCFRDNVKGISLNSRNMVMLKAVEVKK